jgi:tripartite-type tricarboxylate transporter receptor subunit TctC
VFTAGAAFDAQIKQSITDTESVLKELGLA